MKFAHIADTHIKNLKYHHEYKIIFQKIYDSIRAEQVDYIVHCGDIAHTKTQISPEFVELCADFFRNLSSIAPTYIILGNHDGNLRNSSRQDALTPIVEALNDPNIHLLKNSGEVPLKGNITLNVLSVFDESGWVKPSDKDRINIALYHGSVSGVVTDTGWVMTHGDHPIEIFEEFDYAFLGDIHKTDQSIDMHGKMRYPGSTIQQNHGETDDKGFLLWEIQNKDDFTCRHIEIKNPRPFVTIELTPKGKMPKGLKIPEKSRLRLVSKNNLPLDVMRKATDVAKRRFRPESVTFTNRAAGSRGNVEDITNGLEAEDLRNIKIQESLIKEYLKDYEPDGALMKRILDLNLKYNKLAEEGEEVSRNINWSLRKLEFDNLFNYGEGNSIDFDKLEGIVGIFGKNFSGKSSIIDSLLYTIFNSTSKNDRKTVNIINQNEESAEGQVHITVGDKDYCIARSSEKWTKNLKGEQTIEAKTNVTFTSIDGETGACENLNGESRTKTDKNIRKMFGTLDDFLHSSMASQLDSLAFIKEGSTKRKEILAKFLDLKFFEAKFKLAKEDASNTRGALKKLENKDFEEEISLAKEELEKSNNDLNGVKKAVDRYKTAISELEKEMSEVGEKIKSVPAEIIDIAKVRKELRDKKRQMVSIKDKSDEHTKKREDYRYDYEQIACFLKEFDEEALYGKQEKVDEFKVAIANLDESLFREEKDLQDNQKRVQLLSGIPCGTSFPKCKFIRDAYASKATIPVNQGNLSDLNKQKEDISSQMSDLDPSLIALQIEKYREIIDRKNELSNLIMNCNLNIENSASAIENLVLQVDKLESKISTYESNREAIENLEKLVGRQEEIKFKNESLRVKLTAFNDKMMGLYKLVGSLEQKLQNVTLQREEYLDLREEYSAYDLYMRSMHSNGIAFDVIRKKLPVINEEIAKILANIVDFEVFFEDNDKRLDIFIKHPSYDPRPLEMGSGAEKTISAMAIRLALLSVSSLPKSDIFILDEPGTALDEENMQGFIDILEIIRSYFKTVLLISHLDSLKDCVDMQITIDKGKKYARVRE